MKNQLFPKIYDLDNLYQSWNRIKRKNTAGGIDNISVEDFEKKIESNLKEISLCLQRGTYVPEPYKRVRIPKSNLKEIRKISIPIIKDKIVQEATKRIIEPVFNTIFVDNSFAYRPNKGPQKAIYEVVKHLKFGNIWVATYDIDNFFDSINHSLLLKFVSDKIWEEEILKLIEFWLKMGIVNEKEWIDSLVGIPQGGNISPLLSNIYLNQFDIEMKNKGLKIIRYADNMICLEKEKDKVINSFKYCEKFLRKHLFLEINSDSILITNAHNGFVFLGFLFKHKKMIIASEKIEKIKNKIKEMLKEKVGFQNKIDLLNDSIIGWKRYYQIGEVSEQFNFLNNVLIDYLIDYLKTNGISQQDIRTQIQRLEFFTDKTEQEKNNLVSLILAVSKINKLSKKEEVPVKEKKTSISKEILKKRKRYETILAESANLLVASPGTFIGKKSSRLTVREKRKIVKEIPFHRLKNIFIISEGVSISSNLVKRCLEENITINFLDYYGKPYALILSPKFPFFKIGMEQLNAANDHRGVFLAKAFVKGKIKNQVNLIKYYKKYKERKEFEFSQKCDENIRKMQSLSNDLIKLPDETNIENLRPRLMNIEGLVASYYWSLIKLILSKDVYFEGRERRGAADLVNSLLNYGYGILYSEIYRSIIFAGLNPNIGFLHKEQFGKPVLVFDLIEEFRQPIVDKTIIGMIRRKEKFKMEGIYLSDESKQKVVKKVLRKMNNRMNFRGRNISFQDIIRFQAKSIVGFLEGKEKYSPFIDRW